MSLFVSIVVTKGGGHMKHNHEPISEAFEKFKEDVAVSLKPMEEQVSVITRAFGRAEVLF